MGARPPLYLTWNLGELTTRYGASVLTAVMELPHLSTYAVKPLTGPPVPTASVPLTVYASAKMGLSYLCLSAALPSFILKREPSMPPMAASTQLVARAVALMLTTVLQRNLPSAV